MYNNINNNDISNSIASVSAEDIFPPHFDVRPRYRGAAVVDRSHLQLAFNSNNDISLIEINESRSSAAVLVRSSDEYIKNEGEKLNIPNAPLYLVPTHFVINSCIDIIVLRIHHVLGNVAGVSCEFLNNGYEWNGVFMNGVSYCNFQVHIYSSNNDDGYIVEINRLSGDPNIFKCIYMKLKESVNESIGGEELIFQSLSDFSPHELLSDSKIESALKPIMNMATSELLDSQREGTSIICSLSSHDDMQQPLCDFGIIKVLLELIHSPDSTVRRHVIFALGNLSTSPSCQEAMLSVDLIKIFLEMTADGPYQTAQVRKEGVRILANLANRFPKQIISAVGESILSTWMDSIDSVLDAKLKIHALNAKESFKEHLNIYYYI